MKKFLSLVVFAFVVGCSNNPVVPFEASVCVTEGLDHNITASIVDDVLIVNSFKGKVTRTEILFYLPEHEGYKVGTRINLPNCIKVNQYTFDNLNLVIIQDANNKWFAQFSRNESNLSASVGADIEICEFSFGVK